MGEDGRDQGRRPSRTHDAKLSRLCTRNPDSAVARHIRLEPDETDDARDRDCGDGEQFHGESPIGPLMHSQSRHARGRAYTDQLTMRTTQYR